MHGFSKIENGFWNAKNLKGKTPSAIYHSKPIANKVFPCLPYLLNLQRLAIREEAEMADFFARHNPVKLLRKKLMILAETDVVPLDRTLLRLPQQAPAPLSLLHKVHSAEGKGTPSALSVSHPLVA